MLREIAGDASDRVAVLTTSRPNSPCAVGWRRPTILLPEAFLSEASPAQLRWALAHEWAHVQRGDIALWSLASLLRALYFFHPLVWWLRRQLRLDQDYLADAQASGADQRAEAAEDYAQFLMTFASGAGQGTPRAGLGIGGGNSDLHRRIVMLVEHRRVLEQSVPRRWSIAAFTVALALLSAAAMLRAEQAQQPTQQLAEDPFVLEPPAEIIEATPPDPNKPKAETYEAQPDGAVKAATQSQPATQQTQGAGLAGAQPARTKATKPTARRIQPGDVLIVDVLPNVTNPVPGMPTILLRPNLKLTVDAEGRLSLGTAYGSVNIGGETLQGAAAGIRGAIHNQIVEDQLERRKANGDKETRIDIPKMNVQLEFANPPINTATYVTVPDIVTAAVPTATPYLNLVSPANNMPAPPLPAESHDPNLIWPGDSLNIEVVGLPPDMEIHKHARVEVSGTIALGAQWGRIMVKGLTLEAAEKLLRYELAKTVNEPEVQITFQEHQPRFLTNFSTREAELGQLIEHQKKRIDELEQLLKQREAPQSTPKAIQPLNPARN